MALQQRKELSFAICIFDNQPKYNHIFIESKKVVYFITSSIQTVIDMADKGYINIDHIYSSVRSEWETNFLFQLPLLPQKEYHLAFNISYKKCNVFNSFHQ